jgi:hypothetical protein
VPPAAELLGGRDEVAEGDEVEHAGAGLEQVAAAAPV